MKLASYDFLDGEGIPMEYTCEGAGITPELIWEDVPENAASLALTVQDPDAPGGVFTHWIVYNISADIKGIDKGASSGDRRNEKFIYFGEMFQGLNDFDELGYFPACPPEGEHRYVFKLYALDEGAELFEPGLNIEQFEKAIEGHVIETAELVGTYIKKSK